MKNPLACLVTLGMIVLPSLNASADATHPAVSNHLQMVDSVKPLDKANQTKTPDEDDKIDLLSVIHDGEKLTYDQFRKRVGDDFAAKFKSIKPKSIERSGNQFILTTEATEHSKYGLTVYISGAVTFEAVKVNRVLTATKIVGVEVQVGPKRMKLREVVFTPLPNGMARIDGKLEISSHLPYIPVSVTVDRHKVHQ